MYIPKEFLISDRQVILDFIRKNGFGLLVTSGEYPEASHIPMIVVDDDPIRIWGHLAVGNQQLSGLNGAKVLLVFGGPHAYISPTWYAVPGQVPTWNYATVHAYGIAKLSSRRETTEMLEKMVAFFEEKSPLSGRMREEKYQDIMSGIVGFHVDVVSVQGKFKMSQNHSVEDRIGVIKHLKGSSDPYEREVAELVRQTIPQNGANKDF